MTPRDNPLLSSALSRVVSAFSAVCRTCGEADFPAFSSLLDDPKLGLRPDEQSAIQAASEQRLTAELWVELTRRRDKGAFPYSLRPKRRRILH
jgi:hypothetical protein